MEERADGWMVEGSDRSTDRMDGQDSSDGRVKELGLCARISTTHQADVLLHQLFFGGTVRHLKDNSHDFDIRNEDLEALVHPLDFPLTLGLVLLELPLVRGD